MDFVAATMERRTQLGRQIPSPGDSAGMERIKSKTDQPLDEETRVVAEYLNLFENLAVGANFGVLDERLLARTLGGVVKRTVEAYAWWIAARRAHVPSNSLYSELVEFCLRLHESQGTAPSSDVIALRKPAASTVPVAANAQLNG